MLLNICKAKLNRAKVTSANVEYHGSLTVDQEILERLNIFENEKVLLVNLSNSNRFETYVMAGERGKREIGLNGGAALLGKVGDTIGFASFALMTEEEAKNFTQKIVSLDEHGMIVSIKE